MKNGNQFEGTTRRSFVKKSVVAAVAASNLTIFSGLVNATPSGLIYPAYFLYDHFVNCNKTFYQDGEVDPFGRWVELPDLICEVSYCLDKKRFVCGNNFNANGDDLVVVKIDCNQTGRCIPAGGAPGAVGPGPGWKEIENPNKP